MPIRPEFRRFYGRAWREEIRPRILERARNRCERCGKPDYGRVYTITWRDGATARMAWCAEPAVIVSAWRDDRGARNLPGLRERLKLAPGMRAIRVILTVAHLNHTPGDDRDENLMALCQWCHLHYDQAHHKETRSARKDAARPLLAKAQA